MRSLGVVTFAILLTGYSYGQNPPTLTNLNAGDSLYTAVLTFTSVVEKCYLETPSGGIVQFKPVDESDDRIQLLPDTEFIGCRANVTNLDVNDSGLWTLHTDLQGGESRSQSYNLTVNLPQESTTTTTAIPTTTEIPTTTTTESPEIRYLEERHFDSKIGDVRIISIVDSIFMSSDRCRVITPSGEQYNLDEIKLSNVKVTEDTDDLCAITIHVQSEDEVGNWMLISEGSEYSERIERRLPFSINVEEIVDASVNEVTVVEGNDLYVRLKNAIVNYDTCRLHRPEGNVYYTDIDSRYIQQCGYIVRNMNISNSGEWSIFYGNRIIYRAPIYVIVNATTSVELSNLVWTRDRPVNVTLGPENGIYCRVESPEGFEYYSGFGRCQVTIDRVLSRHAGIWKISVGLPGRVHTQDSEVHIRVVEAESRPLVTTQVVANKPTVSLSCFVSSPYNLRSCKFRDPSGNILLANDGVGEDRFTFHGAEVSYQSDLHAHDCGLQITNPVVADLGLWRCAVETEGDIYYGFLSVLCPWAMRDPEVAAAVISEPTLTATRHTVTSVVGDSVTMSCSVQSAIRYCYFRARNGTVFSVGPGDSHDHATYVGTGFDAGECGIRFSTLSASDTGAWTCHVGFNDASLPEQRASIALTMHDPIVVSQHMQGSQLTVKGQVYDYRELEYCRFVRIDGLGFTDENVPDNYSDLTSLSRGTCEIAIYNPSIMEHHPWTVVAKIRGQDAEISGQTIMSIQAPGNPEEPITIYYRIPVAWIVMMAVGLSLVLLVMLLGPVKNRQWTYRRASAIRNSFMKKAVAENVQNNNNNNTHTAVAA